MTISDDGDLQFDWDPAKAARNSSKHGIDFDEAKTVFLDPNVKLFSDGEHSWDEDRAIALGISQKQRILLVVHVIRDLTSQEIIHIISARLADKSERNQYETTGK